MRLAPLLSSFADELEKIACGDMMQYFQDNPDKYREYKARQQAKKKHAMVGAILGGAAGAKLTGGAKGLIGGAVLGHLTGAALKNTKRALWDEYNAREHATLYGHQPSYSAADQQGSFY